MVTVWTDVRLAARALRKDAGFTSMAALVLAVGIGATSITFSLIDATLLRPLPYRDPSRLVMVWEHSPADARSRVSPLNFLDWSEQSHVFESMAGVVPISRVLTNPSGAATRIPAQIVTSSFFDVLGVRPIAGRTFVGDDTQPHATAQDRHAMNKGQRWWQSSSRCVPPCEAAVAGRSA